MRHNTKDASRFRVLQPLQGAFPALRKVQPGLRYTYMARHLLGVEEKGSESWRMGRGNESWE